MSLAALESFIVSLDSRKELNGLAYSLTNNKQLGYDQQDPFSPFQCIPYGTWERYDRPEAQIPSVLEQAFRDTIVLGHQIDGRPDAKYSFIDILQLEQPDPIFFTQPLLQGPDKGKTLVDVLAATVNAMDPDVTPVIRYLVGNPTPPAAGPSPAEYVEVFWPQSSKEPIFKHPKAVLYVGSYNPDIELEHDMEGVVDRWIKALVDDLDGGDKVYETLKSVANDMIKTTVAAPIPPVTWNHAKIVAVNGRALLTGGANYFEIYSSGQDGLIDNSITILGDAAVTAHKYADYLWTYLNSDHQPFDTASNAWSTLLATPRPSGGIPKAQKPTPMFPTNIPGLEGKVPVLALNKIGNFNPVDKVQYPAQILTAVRDIFYQIVWAKDANLLPLAATLSSDSALDSVFAEVGVSPATWASRAARVYAIAQAQDHVLLSQQMLVNWLLVPQKAWQSIVAKINGDLGLLWDGKIWPFEIIISIATAITTIETKHQNDPDPTKAVYLMVSEFASPTDPKPQDYQDTTTIADLTGRIVTTVRALGSFPPDQVPGIVARRFHVKRSVLKPHGPDENTNSTLADKPVTKKLHTKVVDVDGALLYVGSDNAYPQWNEQFGVWIEDRDRIKAWEDGFFWGFWKRAVDPKE